MRDSAFIDTNVAIYALTDTSAKGTLALALLKSKPIISTQVVAESINVCLRKFKLAKTDAFNRAEKLIFLSELVLIKQSTFKQAFNLSTNTSDALSF